MEGMLPWVVLALSVLAVLLLLRRPLGALGRLGVRSVVGLGGIWLFNHVGALIGVQVGVNLVSGLGFKALGLEAVPVETAEQAKAALHRMAKEDYAVIYLTETFAADMSAEIEHYKDELKPAIILIPGRQGSLGIGKANLRKAVERAVGADIL